MADRVYILGGYQTDFSQNWARNGIEIFDAFGGTVRSAIEAVDLQPEDIEVAHVGNFAAELFVARDILVASSPHCIRPFRACPHRATKRPAPPAASRLCPLLPTSKQGATALLP